MKTNHMDNTTGAYPAGVPAKKNLGFGIFLLILVAIFIASCTYLGILIHQNGAQVLESMIPQEFSSEYHFGADSPVQPQATPVQTVPLKPTATPSPEDRVPPDLDGVAPVLVPGVDSNTIPDIFESVEPSVVGVLNYAVTEFGGKQFTEAYASGTGFIVSTKGYVLTNAHVIEGAQFVTVLLPIGEELDATVIGVDTETDIAVLKVEHPDLKALAIGNSDEVRVGEFVLAIGNPLDVTLLTNTLTYGIISAKGREVNIDGHTNTYLQTDAAVNYGNSGGPLLNLKGEVIGMNTAKSVTAGYDSYGNAISAEGIGYALPINTVIEIMEKLIEFGTVERPAVGIEVSTLTEIGAHELGVPQGVYVESVVKAGPAAMAGVLAGDVILAANGQSITEQQQLIDIINTCSIGDSIELLIWRDGKEITCTVELSNKAAMDFEDVEEPVDEN